MLQLPNPVQDATYYADVNLKRLLSWLGYTLAITAMTFVLCLLTSGISFSSSLAFGQLWAFSIGSQRWQHVQLRLACGSGDWTLYYTKQAYGRALCVVSHAGHLDLFDLTATNHLSDFDAYRLPKTGFGRFDIGHSDSERISALSSRLRFTLGYCDLDW